MDTYKETFDTWNNIADLYQQKFMDLDLYNESYDFLCSKLMQRGAKVLDVGCGPGNISKYLLAKRPDFDITGIDVAPNMVLLAQKNNPSARYVVMDCRNIAQLPSKFDGIVGGFCLPYLSLQESQQFFSDAYALLQDDGLLYLSFVAGAPMKSGFKEGSGGRVYFYYHRVEDIMDQLSGLKFLHLKTFVVQYPVAGGAYEEHTILIVQKQKLH
jgi:cyclopropane fatty-acyl-phospholipid synthase-like methyltransferase